MNLFPIGEINAVDSTGTIDGITYSFFGPNNGTKSLRNYNNLVSLFQTQNKQTRKKAEPFLSLTYVYENIWDREYRQLEHFVDYVEDALTSFYAVDFSRGVKPTNIVAPSSDWQISIVNTRLYSTILNHKASYAFAWDGDLWRLGRITDITNGSQIDMEPTYGNLSLARAQDMAYIYPLYSVYLNPNALADFEVGEFIREDVTFNTTDANSLDGGFMYSGTIGFNSKYSI